MSEKIVEFINKKGYEMINDNLGSGSFGQTVLLKDNSIDELIVCKKYSPQAGLNPEDYYDNFKKEIKIMFKLNHPNIVRIYNYYLYDQVHTGYILMEYIDGKSIDKWFSCYPILKSDSNQIFRQLIEAFDCIEKAGIIHRDIRESNILITKNDQVKIIDFGLGKNVNEQNISMDSFNTLINRNKMEIYPQEFNEKKYTIKTDMFCLAELYNRLIKTYKINDFKYYNILNKMMNLEPAKRFNSFSDILINLDKKDFQQLEISMQDKIIYRKFINTLTDAIYYYLTEINIEDNIVNIINGLAEILEVNCLNEYIQPNSKLINIFIHGSCTYKIDKKIEFDIVKDFYDWLCSKDENFQNIIIKNIVNKLASIPIESEDDLPF